MHKDFVLCGYDFGEPREMIGMVDCLISKILDGFWLEGDCFYFFLLLTTLVAVTFI